MPGYRGALLEEGKSVVNRVSCKRHIQSDNRIANGGRAANWPFAD
jgi:hypothetical protein